MTQHAHHPDSPCTDPARHVHDGASFMQEVARLCDARGVRLTALREMALRLIVEAGQPVKAYELLDRMKKMHDSAAPPTVYRALEFLLDNGFIHKLSSINAFTACHHPGSQHTVPFLICTACQSATELEDEHIVNLLETRAKAAGFATTAQILEVHGKCRDCVATG